MSYVLLWTSDRGELAIFVFVHIFCHLFPFCNLFPLFFPLFGNKKDKDFRLHCLNQTKAWMPELRIELHPGNCSLTHEFHPLSFPSSFSLNCCQAVLEPPLVVKVLSEWPCGCPRFTWSGSESEGNAALPFKRPSGFPRVDLHGINCTQWCHSRSQWPNGVELVYSRYTAGQSNPTTSRLDTPFCEVTKGMDFVMTGNMWPIG